MNSKRIAVFLLLVLCVSFTLPVPAFAASTPTGGDSDKGFFASVLAFFGDLFNGLLNLSPSEPVVSAPTTIPPVISKPTGAKEVIGFYAEWWGNDTASYNDMVKHKDSIGTIAPFWATLNRDASVANRGGNDHAAVVKYAKSNSIQTLLLVNNEKSTGSVKPIHTVLSNSSLRKKAIDNLEAYIKKYQMDGINIDFEEVPAGDRDNLTAFMKELYARLKPQGYVVTIDVFPKHNELGDISKAYDYAKLAQYADKIMLMTYDYHGGWSEAGAVSDIVSVEQDLQYALSFIPKHKLYLGIPGYGYDWSSKGVESLEYPAIQSLISRFNPKVEWDDASKSPHFNYTGPDGVSHQVWFENSHSLRFKLDLVNKYDIAGIALWKLGSEDQEFWPLIKTHFAY
ncbi:glycoside hydrolase family 18 [Anaerosporomusa subterranea]|uniref:Glycoside hydrolase family 18 n=1 Tax=Anaerosporomusa subterranea TaxID=1794912 RepID=A0A154BRQ7_ANASB|nr:glycosyl hydrolase family 18 protein [Anaerosporomusa subterranea]KYZ76694.1 glycoside hydrolase family 18 [Anaerosporomusa subterranea]